MAKDTNQKRRFHSKIQSLSLYLSIGIIGIGMLAFSAWTPSSVNTGASADPNHFLHSEHDPDNSQPDSSNIGTPDDKPSTSGDAEEGNSNSKNPSDSSITPSATPVPATPTPTDLPPATPTPTPNPLLTDAYAEVNELVKAYYDAKLSGEADDFAPLVSDTTTIDTDYLHIQYGLVTDFSNFTCYTKNGINEIAYVVYVGYDSKIVTIDTPVPTLDRLTLVYAADGSGKLLVNTAPELSAEATAYFDELSTHADVQEMYRRETERFEAAIDSDPELQQLYNRLDTEGAD